VLVSWAGSAGWAPGTAQVGLASTSLFFCSGFFFFFCFLISFISFAFVIQIDSN
jgi:hypothetical protein